MAPRIAPLIAALGGEVSGLAPRDVLSDATKLAGSVRDLARSLGVDVATVEFASRWDLGAALDWSTYPPAVRPGQTGGDASAGRGAATLTGAPGPGGGAATPGGDLAGVLLDAVARVRAELDARVTVAASVTGPMLAARLTAADRATDAVAAAAKRALGAVRALAEAGAGLIWLVEDAQAPPDDPRAYARALAPVLGTARFYRADVALHIAGAADGWLDAVRGLRGAIACFDPAASPALAAEPRPFGVTVAPGARALAADAALVTHDGELAGRVPARDLRAAVDALRP
ncbi:MAG TPA: hypothetical protein VNS09_01305 [Solirubrobacter sp.]|nr:hypothetical protein [Solirubrobacter sp.]